LRTVDKVDRRYVTLTPTAKGKEASARITEGLHAMMREVLGGMAPRKRLLLTKCL
jgi:DNA-binding MarR family transcriptional regulator